jgi:hypothetical protein
MAMSVLWRMMMAAIDDEERLSETSVVGIIHDCVLSRSATHAESVSHITAFSNAEASLQ